MSPDGPEHAWKDRPLRLVLFGGPGVGKGTQAEILRDCLNVVHFSTGELFRSMMKDGATTQAMRKAIECINTGCLVPDDVVIEMVGERIAAMDAAKGLLLDGFPRTVPQAEALDRFLRLRGMQLDAVLDLELPQALLIERLSGRRTCVQCGASYHKINRPSKVKATCDLCGGRLVQRNDDQPEAIHVRLDAYARSTRPLVEFYKTSGRLVEIPADGTPQDVSARALNLLSAHLYPPQPVQVCETRLA